MAALANGGGVAFPTGCGYGFAVDPWRPEAGALIEALKPGRGDRVGLIAADFEQVHSLVSGAMDSGAAAALAALWPAELTLVLPARPELPRLITSEAGGVAVRIPASAQARALAAAYGRPLTATSLNRPGELPATGLSALAPFAELLAGVLPGTAGSGLPSTLVDLCTEPPTLLRQGAVPWS